MLGSKLNLFGSITLATRICLQSRSNVVPESSGNELSAGKAAERRAKGSLPRFALQAADLQANRACEGVVFQECFCV